MARQDSSKNEHISFDGILDQLTIPHSPIERALKTTVKALKSNGHKVTHWDFPYLEVL